MSLGAVLSPPEDESEDGPLSLVDLGISVTVGFALIGIAATAGLLAGLVGLGAAVYLVYCLKRPQLIGYTLVALVPVTSGLARGLPVPGVRLPEIMIVAAAVVVLPRQIGRVDRRWSTLDWAALAFVACHVIVGGISGTLNGALGDGGVSTLVGPVQFFLLYRTVSATLTTPTQRRFGLRLLLWMSVPVVLLALAQFMQVPGTLTAIQQLTDSEIFDSWSYEFNQRATGPFASWHPLAGYLFLVIVALIALLTSDNTQLMSKRWLAGLLTGCVAALVVSQTLNVVAGALLAAVVVTALRGQVSRFVVPAIAFLAVSSVVFGPVIAQRLETQEVVDPTNDAAFQLPQTIQYRIDVWQDQYFPAIGRNWMAGYGPALPPEITWRSTESLYFTLLLRGGVVLFGAYAVLMFIVVRRGLRHRSSADPVTQTVALTLVAGTIALVPMHGVFPYFTASGLPQVFWILLALGSLSEQSGRAAEDQEEESADQTTRPTGSTVGPA